MAALHTLWCASAASLRVKRRAAAVQTLHACSVAGPEMASGRAADAGGTRPRCCAPAAGSTPTTVWTRGARRGRGPKCTRRFQVPWGMGRLRLVLTLALAKKQKASWCLQTLTPLPHFTRAETLSKSGARYTWPPTATLPGSAGVEHAASAGAAAAEEKLL